MPMILKPRGTPGKCPAHVRAWTPEEDELLINLHGKKTAVEIAARLPAPGRAVFAVRQRTYILSKRFPDRFGYVKQPWTPEDDRFLRRNCHTMTAKEIGNRLKQRRTERAVILRAHRLGISLYKCGDNYPRTRHKDEDVELIRELRDNSDLTFKEIGEKFDISVGVAFWLYCGRMTADDAIAREYLPR
ncbi:TPA: AsnC family protein [Salmonella enterica subsp. diarizonae serovar 60-67:z35:-]